MFQTPACRYTMTLVGTDAVQGGLLQAHANHESDGGVIKLDGIQPDDDSC